MSMNCWRCACFLALFVCSCASQGPNGSARKYYFGFTVVTTPRQAGNCKGMDAKEVTNYGFSLGLPSGISLGYNQDNSVFVPPEGRNFIAVHTDEQFEAAKKLIEQHNNIGICVIQPSK